MKCTGTWNKNRPSKNHFQSKTWSRPFFLHCPININLQNWTPQETYNNFCHIYKTSKLSHQKYEILMIFYLIWTESGAKWYAPISFSWVIGSGGYRISKEHNYGEQRSYVPVTMNSISPPQCWWTISHIPLQHTQWFSIPQLNVRNGWIKCHLQSGTYNTIRPWLGYFSLIVIDLKYAQIIQIPLIFFNIWK